MFYLKEMKIVKEDIMNKYMQCKYKFQKKNQSGQDPLNFPIRVNNRLAYLRKSVESGDGLPTKGSREVFKLLKDELLGYTNSLDKLKKEFNRYL